MLALASLALTQPGHAVAGEDMTTTPQMIPPSAVAGFDPESRAIVNFSVDDLTFNIPRNALAGMFVGPLYCESGKGVCGKVWSPRIALLYPDFRIVPANLVKKYEKSPWQQHDMIYAVMIGQRDEPARVSAFLRDLDPRNLKAGPYGLYYFPQVSSILVGYPETSDHVAITFGEVLLPKPGKYCNAQKYILGGFDLNFQFDVSLFPQWAEIDRELTRIIKSWVRR